jgi:hypothetical protein
MDTPVMNESLQPLYPEIPEPKYEAPGPLEPNPFGLLPSTGSLQQGPAIDAASLFDTFAGASGSEVINSGPSVLEQYESRLSDIYAERLIERLKSGEMRALTNTSPRDLVPEFFEGDYPKPEPVSKPFEDRSWMFDQGFSPKTQAAESSEQLTHRPYNLPIRANAPRLRANPLERKLAGHFKLPDDMFCPKCGSQLDYEGRCPNSTCPNYGHVIDQEKFDEFQKQVEENNIDVMKRWNEEMERLS